jgi:hypothetical protein
VLGEGDRRAPAAGAAHVAAPPLRDPMGRTLFSDIAAPLRDAGGPPVAVLADRLYGAVRQARRAMAPRPGRAPAR